MNPSYTLNGYQRGEIDGAHIRYCPTPPFKVEHRNKLMKTMT